MEEDHPKPRRRIRFLGLLSELRDDPLSAAILENPYRAAPRFSQPLDGHLIPGA
jgi:hypothetical protein